MNGIPVLYYKKVGEEYKATITNTIECPVSIDWKGDKFKKTLSLCTCAKSGIRVISMVKPELRPYFDSHSSLQFSIFLRLP